MCYAIYSLNPFRTGRCLSTDEFLATIKERQRLNPFRTGRCLSTALKNLIIIGGSVSIPFEQGDVFRL